MNLFGLGPNDIKKKLNPKNTPHLFMGSDSTVEVADVEEVLEEHSDTVCSRIPAIYSALTEHVDGEILERSAIGGETTVQLGLYPASKVRIWVNLDRPWTSRRSSDSLSDGRGCSVNAATGLVTLDTPLQEDDTVVGEYDHTALTRCYLLRRIVIDLAAVEMARRLYPDDQRFSRYEEWEKRAHYDLARMKGTKDGERMGIRMFDRLKLIEETQEERAVGGGELDSAMILL